MGWFKKKYEPDWKGLYEGNLRSTQRWLDKYIYMENVYLKLLLEFKRQQKGHLKVARKLTRLRNILKENGIDKHRYGNKQASEGMAERKEAFTCACGKADRCSCKK